MQGNSFSPLEKAMTEASKPCKNSSITILIPASPWIFLIIKSWMVVSASSKFLQITTPFPLANPLAFITNGKACVFT